MEAPSHYHHPHSIGPAVLFFFPAFHFELQTHRKLQKEITESPVSFTQLPQRFILHDRPFLS